MVASTIIKVVKKGLMPVSSIYQLKNYRLWNTKLMVLLSAIGAERSVMEDVTINLWNLSTETFLIMKITKTSWVGNRLYIVLGSIVVTLVNYKGKNTRRSAQKMG
jgi:hypothetical protein